MIRAYHIGPKGLVAGPAETAIWLDLFDPTDAELAAQRADLPSLAEMEEIEISNRLYRDDGTDFMTIVLPGMNRASEQILGPVCFVLAPDRLITLRHHSPRPFETYPDRAGRAAAGCDTAPEIMAGLTEEIIGRMADHLETVGKILDEVSRLVYRPKGVTQEKLQESLARIGGEGERLSRVRLGLMTLGRALNHLLQSPVTDGPAHAKPREAVRAQIRDIDALEVHADFLAQRLALASDTTLGMINLAQNSASRTASVVAVLFLPPTLIASIYGMNYAHMPELAHPLGYPATLLAMLASALVTWAVFKWKGWL